MWADLFTQAVLVSLLAAAIQNATPILLAGLGETVCELSGVYNMGLEGTMSIGMIQRIMDDRMFPLTLDGLDRAMRKLTR